MRLKTVTLLSATALGTVLHVPIQAQTAAQEPQAEQAETQVLDELRVLDTAEAQARQALGSSVITAEDIQKRPPVNDLADIIRRQPGVNLTNSGGAGTYGNNRQIDIRGMGPENTLILVDGKPVQSRNSTRMGRDGERNSRGDTNWVPAEEVERIEILRGPAAARYGSGAAGGVINIITKGPATEFRGSLSGYVQQPEDTLESDTKRGNFSLSGPISKGLSFRVYGSYNKTGGDDPSLNAEASEAAEGTTPPGGREGVENKDVNGMIRWAPAEGQRIDLEAGFSRQGNEYAGEYRLGSGATSPDVAALIGEETNVVKRTTGSVNYQGDFDFGTAKLIAQYEHTKNRRINEGLAGGSEGTPSTTTEFSTSTLRNWYVNGSVDVPFEAAGMTHVVSAGGEFRYEYLNDPYAMSQSISGGQTLPGAEAGTRDPDSNADTYAAFLEDNILIGQLTVTPGVRFDRHSTFGSNWSPSLSVSYNPVADLTIKGGIARAFKAPNLYQSNPNYLYYTMGNGCPVDYPNLGGGCYVQGNADLDAERSVNKEIGVAYAPAGWNFSVTYFRNDYDNKIVAGNVPVGTTTGGTTTGRVFQWQNAPKAVVEGVEGNVLIPLGRTLSLNTNATYMIQNENKTTGEKLSVIPDYTINSTLDWQVTEQINLVGTFTRYGKQAPNRVLYSGAAPTEEQLRPRPAYNLVGLTGTFRVNDNMRFGAGVYNLFDKRLFRESQNNAQGANNYNEPGRSFFVTSTLSF